MKKFIERYQKMITAILVTITLACTVMAGTWKFIEWRIEKSVTIDGIRDELVFLNCMFRVSLTKDQQAEAERLYQQVGGICHRKDKK